MALDSSQLRSWPRFVRLWPSIRTLLHEGYAICDVHAALRAEGLWLSGYDVFRCQVKRARRELATEPQAPAPSPSPPAPRPKPTQAPPQAPSLRQPTPTAKRNPLLERRERPEYDYSQLSEATRRLIEPAGDSE